MTDESRKLFIEWHDRSGYRDITSITATCMWHTWQARDAELAAKDARIAEYEQMVCMQGAERVQLVKELCAAAKERDQLRATLAAIEREVGERPERLDTDYDAVFAMALAEHYKHAAEHAALKLVEERQRNERLVAVLHVGRRAIGEHFAPADCYATGPAMGNDYSDLIECPACTFIEMYAKAIAANAVKS